MFPEAAGAHNFLKYPSSYPTQTEADYDIYSDVSVRLTFLSVPASFPSSFFAPRGRLSRSACIWHLATSIDFTPNVLPFTLLPNAHLLLWFHLELFCYPWRIDGYDWIVNFDIAGEGFKAKEWLLIFSDCIQSQEHYFFIL